MHTLLSRRSLLAGIGVAGVQGCAAPLSRLRVAVSSGEAGALLASSSAAHGLAALRDVNDVAVSYAGAWHAFVNLLQPDLVDAGFRGGSQERLLVPARLVAQSHIGPKGHKEVVRQTVPGQQGTVRVWLNGIETADPTRRAAAALVADGYSLFLLGPMLLMPTPWGGREVLMELAAPERIEVFGHAYDCDVLRVRVRPGLGLSAQDDAALYIARDDRLMRRVRFTLQGLDATQGAVAEVDTSDHLSLSGIAWPTRFHERLIRPVPTAVHDWQLTGLDLNRGLTTAELDGAALQAQAKPPAVTRTR